MQVILMAGGSGSRLGALTAGLPKALLPYGDSTLAGSLLTCLMAHGMSEAVLCIGPARYKDLYQSSIGTDWRGVPLRYSEEPEPLGTAGGLRLIAGLQEDFLVVNCDIVTNLSFTALFRAHRESCAAATVATGEWVERLRFGTVQSAEDGRISGLCEKPEIRQQIILGAYVLKRDAIFSALPLPLGRIDMPDLLARIISAGEVVQAFPTRDFWRDVGTPADYENLLAGDCKQT